MKLSDILKKAPLIGAFLFLVPCETTMNSVAYFLIGTGVILALLFALLIFYGAGWKWRENPARPFAIGAALLLLAYGVDFLLGVKAADIKAFLEDESPTLKQEAVHLFLETVLTHDWLAKLLELFVIPLAVAIVATALVARVDLDLEKVQERFNKADARITDLEEQKKRYIKAVDQGIRCGILDASFFDAYNKLNAINKQLLDEKDEFREQFGKLAHSGLRHRFRRRER